MPRLDSEHNPIQDQVFAVCNDLYSKGQKPTVRLVLSLLPDVRSTSTVHKYYAMWKTELEAGQQSLYDKLGFSVEFTQAFMKEITRFGVEAEQRYKEQADDANEQRDIAIEELARIEDRLHKQLAVVEQQQKQIKSLEAELSQAIKTQEVRVAELRQQLSERDQENKDLAKTNETLRTNIAKAELKLEGNTAYTEEVKAQNQVLSAENKDLNRQIAEMSKVAAGHESTIAGNEKLITQQAAMQTQLQSALDKLTAEHAEQASELKDVRKVLDVERESHAAANDKLAAEVQSVAELKRIVSEQLAVIGNFTGSESP